MTRRKLTALCLLAGAAHAPLLAQQALPSAVPAPVEAQDVGIDEPEADEPPVEEIVVQGTRPRGAVLGDIPAERSLTGRDIRAYGAGSLSELLDALAPQTQSARGRGGGGPVTLLNGRRISGFSEIRDIPPEAIERIDILPEEVALKYGYRADQRVVNVVLRRRFRAVTAEAEAGFATAGGRGAHEVDLDVLRITEDGRWSADLEYRRETPLFESERDLVQSAPGRPFALQGNVAAATPGAEIDPALSALAGSPLAIAPVPASAAAGQPPLAAFASGAVAATDLAPYRTLLPERDELSLSGTLNRTVLGDISATVNARFDASSTTGRFGLPTASLLVPAGNPFSPFASDVVLYRYLDVPGVLTRDADSRSGHLGIALNGDIAPWRWSLTANYDVGRTTTRNDAGLDLADLQARLDADDPQVNPFGTLDGLVVEAARDRAKSIDRNANAELVANGSLIDLPAGDLSVTLRAGAATLGIDSDAVRGGLVERRDLSRDRANLQGNLDVPLASRRRDVLSAIGDLSLNANLEVEQLSDFGTLTTFGYGLNWSPIEALRLIASVTEEDGAPSIRQLGDPALATPNVRVLDFVRGETVDVTRIEGGNPDLRADSRRVTKLGLNFRPWEERDLSLRVDYVRSRTRDPIASFPTATREIEAAFPDRFARDAEGRLLRIDARPVNFERADTEELRWGISFSKPIGTPGRQGDGRRGARPEGAAAPDAAGRPATTQGARGARQGGAAGTPAPQDGQGRPAPGADRPIAGSDVPGLGRLRGGFGRGGFGDRGGRLQLSLFHTWRLEDEVLIRQGVPELDFLAGSASGNRGGRPRHEIQAEAGLFKDGLGVRLNAAWQDATLVRGGPDARDGDLFFSGVTTLNLRLFADLGQRRALVDKNRWMRGMRVSVAVDNLLDTGVRVRDEAGVTPLGYQRDYLDPLGRSVRITLRKLFLPDRRRQR